ncbi:hypothetical protein AAFF_G00266190, partial [Aldrovandia affinis]
MRVLLKSQPRKRLNESNTHTHTHTHTYTHTHTHTRLSLTAGIGGDQPHCPRLARDHTPPHLIPVCCVNRTRPSGVHSSSPARLGCVGCVGCADPRHSPAAGSRSPGSGIPVWTGGSFVGRPYAFQRRACTGERSE